MSTRSSGTPLGQLIVPALAVALAVWFARADADFPMVPVLLGATAAALVLVLNSPAWVIAPLLVPELSIFNYSIDEIGLTLRLALVMVGLAVTVRTVLQGVRFGDPLVRRVLMPTLAFVLLSTVINVLFSDVDYVFKYFRYQVAQLLAVVLVAGLIRNRTELRRIALVALGLAALSGLAAIWQHFDRESAFYGMADAGSVVEWKSRSLGLSHSPVVLANNMLFVLVPLLGLVVAGATPTARVRALVWSGIALTGLGMYFTYTRSGLIGAGVGLAVMGLYLRGNRRTTVLGAVVALFVVYQVALTMGLLGARYSKNTTNDRSAASHDALLTVGLAIAMDNFVVGVGHQRFEEISAQYAGVLQGDGGSAGGAVALGVERPHNDFLSVIISWGIATFVAYLLVMAGALRNFAIASRSQDALVRGLAVGGAGGLVAYAVNSAFHNSLDSSSALWLYAGLSVALARMPAGRRAADHVRRFARRPIAPRRRIQSRRFA